MSTVATALPPLLREGDRLNAREFLKRWEAMPELYRAELINGVVFVPSPVRNDHGSVQVAIGAWAWLYQDSTPGLGCGSESTWLMGARDVPQPDVYLRVLPDFGGQSTDAGEYVAGAPELIVEVSGSSLSRDLGAKKLLYQKAGVRESLTIQLHPKQIIWRSLVRGAYKDLAPGADGWLRSRIFPGLWLDPAAVWTPGQSLRTALEQGLASPEHAAFVEKLRKKSRAR